MKRVLLVLALTIGISATAVAQQKIGHIDVLHIDTEGFDLEVIKTMDFKKCGTPSLCLVEVRHLSDADFGEMTSILRPFFGCMLNTGSDLLAYNGVLMSFIVFCVRPLSYFIHLCRKYLPINS